jgi:hypothetical protein
MNTEHIVGSWVFVKATKDGADCPMECPGNYTFNADGSGSFDMQRGASIPLVWKFVGEKLRFGAPWGKGQSTVGFEMPSPDTLIMIDRYRQNLIFERVKKADA